MQNNMDNEESQEVRDDKVLSVRISLFVCLLYNQYYKQDECFKTSSERSMKESVESSVIEKDVGPVIL